MSIHQGIAIGLEIVSSHVFLFLHIGAAAAFCSFFCAIV
jgi:hypothetical protein